MSSEDHAPEINVILCHFRSSAIFILSIFYLVLCASIEITKMSRNTEASEIQTTLDSCEKARAIENDLILKYGEPDYTCTTSYVKGVMVKIWSCVEDKRIVYYSFGHEHGCYNSGFEVYPSDSNELPSSVKNEIMYAGEGNGCWSLLDKKQKPCRKP